jgi:hypothetical protein
MKLAVPRYEASASPEPVGGEDTEPAMNLDADLDDPIGRNYHKARTATWTMLSKQVFPSFEEWFKKVGGLKGLSAEWGSTWEESVSEWADEEFSGLKAGRHKQALVEELATDALRELYYERTRVLESLKFPLTVYRSVDLADEAALRTDKVGIFWTHDEQKATSYWGTDGLTPYILKGVVSDASGDWMETLMRHLDPSGAGEEEEEIRLVEGASVKIVGIRQADLQQWTPLATEAKA